MPQQSWKEKAVSREELACIYSALILADDDIPVTADKIQSILQAAEIEVDSIWPSLYAKALQSVNIKELITNLSTIGAAGGPPVESSTAADGEAKEEEKKPEAPQEEEEDSDEDFGLGLFD